MFTSAAPAVNSGPLPGVMMRVGEIAARDGITAPAVSAKVKRLIASHGLQVTTDRNGRVTSVNVVQYDQLLDKFDDPSKNQKTKTEQVPSMDAARLRAAYYAGELDRLKYEQQIGKLVLREDLEFALEEAGDKIAQAIDGLGGSTDELAAAYEQGGQQALRIKLKELVHQARERVADTLDKMVAAAPEATPIEQREGEGA